VAHAIAATISAVANTFPNAGQIATAHAQNRSEYEQLKNEIRHFRNITLKLNRPELEVVRELGSYSHTRDVLNLESPQVSSRTYRRQKMQTTARRRDAPTTNTAT
jgi:hypothetical protein